jgi:hypothetical protein
LPRISASPAQGSWQTYVSLVWFKATTTLTLVSQPLEIFVNNKVKLTLHGLQQQFVKLQEVGKKWKLNDLLDMLEFNQVHSAVVEIPVSHP